MRTEQDLEEARIVAKFLDVGRSISDEEYVNYVADFIKAMRNEKQNLK